MEEIKTETPVEEQKPIIQHTGTVEGKPNKLRVYFMPQSERMLMEMREFEQDVDIVEIHPNVAIASANRQLLYTMIVYSDKVDDYGDSSQSDSAEY